MMPGGSGRAAGIVAVACLVASSAAGFDEFSVKREQVFEFVQKPAVTRDGDRVTIAFETKGFCDVTVAVENAEGRIVRHLASGVLGPNAPEPLRKNAKRQSVIWDGKDDLGVYIDEVDRLTVRVSLGLEPQFERTLFWSPHKRLGHSDGPRIAPTPEGVYVHEGCGVDSIRLYDHDGRYLRTVYPFPRNRLDAVRGLKRAVFPQDGQKLPLKFGPKHRSTFLTSGDNMVPSPGKYGSAAEAFAVREDHVAIASLFALNRLATDGGTGGFDLEGPETSVIYEQGGKPMAAAPRSAAFSPDGKWLYLTGYPFAWGHTTMWFPCVLRVPYGADARPARAKAGGGHALTRDMAPDVFLGKADVGAAGS